MQDDKITGEEARAGRIVKNGRILKMLLISVAVLAAGFILIGYIKRLDVSLSGFNTEGLNLPSGFVPAFHTWVKFVHGCTHVVAILRKQTQQQKDRVRIMPIKMRTALVVRCQICQSSRRTIAPLGGPAQLRVAVYWVTSLVLPTLPPCGSYTASFQPCDLPVARCGKQLVILARCHVEFAGKPGTVELIGMST